MHQRPPHALLRSVETDLRTLDAYVGTLTSRLALARAMGTRKEFEQVPHSELARIATLSKALTGAVEGALRTMAPALVAHSAAVAELACGGEPSHNADDADRHLSVVRSDASA